MRGSLGLVSLKLSQRVVGCQQSFYARLTQAGVIETVSESGRMSTELLLFTPVSPNGFVSELDVSNLQKVAITEEAKVVTSSTASETFHGILYFFE